MSFYGFIEFSKPKNKSAFLYYTNEQYMQFLNDAKAITNDEIFILKRKKWYKRPYTIDKLQKKASGPYLTCSQLEAHLNEYMHE